VAACASFGATALFENGDLSEWVGDGNGGVYTDTRTAAPAASANNSHRGRFSAVATVGTGG